MMKKLLLAAALVASASVAGAQQFPDLEIFSQSFDAESTSIDPFTSWATDAELNSYYTQYYTNNWQIIALANGTYWAGSCSSFADANQQADAGLVSTKIHVPENGAMLQFEGVNIDSQYHNVPNILDVVVSTTGNEKADFTEENLLKTIRLNAQSQTAGATFTDNAISLSKYAGEDIYIAFINRTTNGGLLLLRDFRVVDYMASMSVTSQQLYTEPGEYPVSVQFNLRTPSTCKGYLAELLVNGEVVSTATSARELSTAYNTYRASFPDKLNIAMDQRIDFTVRVTPNYEGAKSIEISDFIICTEGYPQMVVEEEGTGVGCGFCPLGSAFMAYFTDAYPEQYIGIAVHGGSYASGVMTAPNYSNQFLSAYNTAGGYPFCTLNRTVKPQPHAFNNIQPAIADLLKARSSMKVAINRTIYYENEKKVTVHFTPGICADTETADYRAAVVLVADDLHGTDNNARWAQSNYYSGYSTSQLKGFGITEENSAYLAPYYEVYTKSGSSIKGCRFDHVAMGCWPDWQGNGCPLNSTMSVENPEMYTITFDVPMQTALDGFGVQKMENTAVIVLIFDAKGQIVTARRMHYADFEVSTSGVDAVTASTGMKAERVADHIALEAPAGTLVEIYSLEGAKLGAKVMKSEADVIAPVGYKGLVVVRMSNGNDTYFNKVMF